MEKFGHRPSADTELTPTLLTEFRDVFGLPRQIPKAMTGKILGRFRMKLSTPRFCRGLTDSNNEAFHRRQLTNGDVTSPQALKIYDQRKKIRERGWCRSARL
jgi:hypothetical protein